MAGENFSQSGDLRAIRGGIETLVAAGPGAGGATEAKQDTIIGHIDGIETSLTTLIGHVDGLEGFTDGLETVIASTNTLLTTQAGYVDGLETLLTTQAGYLDGVEGGLTAIADKIIVAPATEAKQDTLIGHVDGIEAALTAANASLDAIEAVPAPMTSANFLANMRSTGTHSSVASAATSTTILAANANRKGARIFNSDANALYLDLSGGTAVAASRAQVKLATDEGYDVPFGLTGLITGIWAADGAGAASVVEFT